MFLINVLLLYWTSLNVQASVIFEDCGSAYDLEAVNIEGCGMRPPCYVTLGDDMAVSVNFFADFVSLDLDQDVVLNINFINSQARVTPEPCETVDCPVRTNALTSFTSTMSVPTSIALNQRGYLRWRVYNEQRRLVLCYSVLVQTQSLLQKILRKTLLQSDNDFSKEDLLLNLQSVNITAVNKRSNLL